MKKLLIIAFLLILTSISVLPVLAEQDVGGTRMMGSGMMTPGYSDSERTPVDEEKIKGYNEEFAKHNKDIADQQRAILVKKHEMAILLIKTTTTKEELLEKQKELQVLMNALQREMLSFRWEMNKKYPEMTSDMYRGCLGSVASFGGHGMREKGFYGPGMMDADDYDEHGPGGMMDPDDFDRHGRNMMEFGRKNWQR